MIRFPERATTHKCQTSFGAFVKTTTQWEGSVEVDGAEIQVLVADIDGAPNPTLLQRLPKILQDLPELERTARQSIGKLTEEYQLDLITDAAEPSEFTLGFSSEQEDWGETIFVDFEDRKVGGWCTVD